MAFIPPVLNPTPDPFFVRELQRIDPDLRVVFGYERYLVKQWAIERRMPPERYFQCYASLLEEDAPRFIEQPVYDTNQPILDEFGDVVGHAIVGYRKFDLAPEFEWVMFSQTLDSRVLTELKRAYAWDRNHPLSRLRFEKEQAEAAKQAAEKKERMEIAFDAIPEVFRATGRTLFGGQPEQIMEGTDL